MDHVALTMPLPIASGLACATIMPAAPHKRLRFRFENRLDRGRDMVSQTILNRIIARFLGEQRKRGSVLHSVISLAVAAVFWVGPSHPEVIPPSNFNHIPYTTRDKTLGSV